jgi:hypothetical protein
MPKAKIKKLKGLFRVLDKKKGHEYKNLCWEDAVRTWNTLEKGIILEQANEDQRKNG